MLGEPANWPNPEEHDRVVVLTFDFSEDCQR